MRISKPHIPAQGHAALLKAVSTIGYAAFPIVLALNPRSNYFAATWRLGAACAFSLYLTSAQTRLTFNRRTWQIIIDDIKSINVLLVLVSRFDTVLFILATHYISVATATIIAESSTITFMVNMAWLHRKRTRYARLSIFDTIPAALAFSGFIIASASETGTIPIPDDPASLKTLTGITLALGCAAISAGIANAFPWAHSVANKIDHQVPKDSTVLFATIMLAAITDFTAAAITVLITLHGPPSTNDIVPLLAGAIAFGTAGITSRKANIITKHFAVNLIGFARPLLVLPTLALTTGLQVANPYLLTIGSIIIIVSNLFMTIHHSKPRTPSNTELGKSGSITDSPDLTN